MPTMPARLPTGQPARASAWFASAAGQAVLASESEAIRMAVAERPGQPWLCLTIAGVSHDPGSRGLLLRSPGRFVRGVLVVPEDPVAVSTDDVPTGRAKRATQDGAEESMMFTADHRTD